MMTLSPWKSAHNCSSTSAAAAASSGGPGLRTPLARAQRAQHVRVPHMLLCVLGLLGISNTACPVAAQQPSPADASAWARNGGELQEGVAAAQLAWESQTRHTAPLRADLSPLATPNTTFDLAHESVASSSHRQILMANNGRRQRLLKILPRCSRCAIEKCFRSKKASQRSRCVGKCKKRGKIHNCSSTKGDFKTCTRSELGQCWDCPNPDLPLEPLIPLASLVISTAAPFVPCVVTTNHPTGCPASGVNIARSGGSSARLLASTCVNYEHRISECESPYFPFGYCECRFAERDARTGRVRQVTRPCHADEFDGEDIPLTSTAGGRVETRVSEHLYESQSPTYTYNTTLTTEEGPAAVTMEYFRGFSVLADRFTYTGAYADDYREDTYERGDNSAAGPGEDEFDDYINFVAFDYARDYINEYTGDYGGGSGDEVYDFRREYEYVVDDDDAAYDYTVEEEAAEYYFQQRDYLFAEQECALRCSFEGGGVLGSVQEEYGVDGPYSVYYDGAPVPFDNCPACLALVNGGGDVSVDPGTPLEPGKFEVFVGDVPQAEQFVPGL